MLLARFQLLLVQVKGFFFMLSFALCLCFTWMNTSTCILYGTLHHADVIVKSLQIQKRVTHLLLPTTWHKNTTQWCSQIWVGSKTNINIITWLVPGINDLNRHACRQDVVACMLLHLVAGIIAIKLAVESILLRSHMGLQNSSISRIVLIYAHSPWDKIKSVFICLDPAAPVSEVKQIFIFFFTYTLF